MPRSALVGSAPAARRGSAEEPMSGRVVAWGAAMNFSWCDDVPPRVDLIHIDALKLYVPDLKQTVQFGPVALQGTLPDAPVGGGQSASYPFWNVANGAAAGPAAVSGP